MMSDRLDPSRSPGRSRGRLITYVRNTGQDARMLFGRLWRGLTSRMPSRLVRRGALGLVAIVAVVAAGLLVRPPAETLDGFIARWNATVEQDDDGLYDELVTESLINERPGAWLRGLESIQELHRQRKKLQPIEGEGDPNFIQVQATPEIGEDTDQARLRFGNDTGEVVLQLARGGWSRRWRIADVESIVADAPESVAVQITTDVELEQVTSDSTAGRTLAEATAETTPLDTEFKLRQVLEAWRVAWQEKEIDAYMAWYADYATIHRTTVVNGREIPETLDKRELRERMQRIAKKYGKIKVDIANLNVRGTHAEAELQFRQEYTAFRNTAAKTETVYHDIGTKWLRFVNDNGEWKIYEEDWRNYVNVPSFPLN